MAKTLIIKDVDFSVNKIVTVAFDAIPCTAIALNVNTLDMTSIGGTATLTATPTPENTTDSISWSSSDTSVATVVDGVVTAVSLGTATITVTCGNQTATCAVTVNNVKPSYVVVGGFNGRKSSDGGYVENVTTSTSLGKYAYVAEDNDDPNVKTANRTGNANEGDFRFVPIKIPAGATHVKITSNAYRDNARLTIQTRFMWFDSTQTTTYSGGVGAKCVDGVAGGTSWDQSEGAYSQTVAIPSVTGLDSVALTIFTDQGFNVYNEDKAEYFDLEFIRQV